MDGTIIVADDDKSIRTILSQALTRAGCRVRVTGAISTLWRWLEDGEGDVLVTDVMMPDGDALDILPVLKRKRPDMPVIVMSAQNTIITAIRATETGAFEYLPKPFDLKEVLQLVSKALNKRNNHKITSLNVTDEETSGANNAMLPLIGRSSIMQDVYRVMARLMLTDLGVLIIGNSGTGKELVARALHDFGQRKGEPFITVNLATLPDELVDEELFGKDVLDSSMGHIKGKFEQAEGGTLFLDEVSDISLRSQGKLLRVLQSGEFSRVSGKEIIKTNVRILSSTNKELKELISEGRFREDLFYRLNVVPIRLPDLNQRVEDIKDLISHFLLISEKAGLGCKTISNDAIKLLEKENWPGNVRELENFIRRLIVMCKDDIISIEHVRKELEGRPLSYKQINLETLSPDRFSSAVEEHLKRYFSLHGDSLPPPGLYDRVIKEIELPLISLSLAANRGNQIKTADLLGINRNTLRKKIKELDINVSRKTKLM